MGKAPKRRRATGRLRRGQLSKKSSYRRTMHLSHEEIGHLHLLQTHMAVRGRFSRVAAMSMYPLLICLILAHQNVILVNSPNAAVVLNCLFCFQQLNYWKCHDQFKELQRLDTLLFDIPLDEEETPLPSPLMASFSSSSSPSPCCCALWSLPSLGAHEEGEKALGRRWKVQPR